MTTGPGWAAGSWEPTPVACNPQGVVQAGVHAVVLDAAMSFAVNAGLSGKDRTGAALELKTETMRPAVAGERLAVRGAVMRQAKQVAFAEARIEDVKGRLVSRSTGTFLVQRELKAGRPRPRRFCHGRLQSAADRCLNPRRWHLVRRVHGCPRRTAFQAVPGRARTSNAGSVSPETSQVSSSFGSEVAASWSFLTSDR